PHELERSPVRPSSRRRAPARLLGSERSGCRVIRFELADQGHRDTAGAAAREALLKAAMETRTPKPSAYAPIALTSASVTAWGRLTTSSERKSDHAPATARDHRRGTARGARVAARISAHPVRTPHAAIS